MAKFQASSRSAYWMSAMRPKESWGGALGMTEAAVTDAARGAEVDCGVD